MLALLQTELFIEYGAFKGFRLSPEGRPYNQTYWVMIKENDVVRVRVGVPISVTLNPRVSGVDANSVYDWLWNQGLAFLEEYQPGSDEEIEDVTVLIDGDIVVAGVFDTPWEKLIIANNGDDAPPF